jgi:hypothetical protein
MIYWLTLFAVVVVAESIAVTPGPRQTTILSIEPGPSPGSEEAATTGAATTKIDGDDGFTVQTTPAAAATNPTRRGGVVLFPRRPPLVNGSISTATLGRPGLGVPRSTTLSTPLTAVPNIRKLQDIFAARRRSTTPPSTQSAEDESNQDGGDHVDPTGNGGEEEEGEGGGIIEEQTEAGRGSGESPSVEAAGKEFLK